MRFTCEDFLSNDTNTVVKINDNSKEKNYGAILIKNDDKNSVMLADWENYEMYLRDKKWSKCLKYAKHEDEYAHEIISKTKVEFLEKNNVVIFHINRVGMDNRMDNLYITTKIDNHSIIEQLSKDIKQLPKYIRWDSTEKKFVFKDHPCMKFAEKKRITINYSGTKSNDATMDEKLYDCLDKLVKVLQKFKDIGYDYEIDEFQEQRISLGEEYNEILKTIHDKYPTIFPDGPYINIDLLKNHFTEELYYLNFMDKLTIRNENYHGPKNIKSDLAYFPDYKTYVLKKGDKYFLWDEEYNDILSRLTINSTDHRVHMSKEVCDILKIDKTSLNKKQMLVQEIIYHIIKRNEWKNGFIIVMKNQLYTDLRVKNLAYVAGESSNFKSTSHFPIFGTDIDLGMKYMPRGVTTTLKKKDVLDVYEFHVRGPSSFLRYDGTTPPNYKDNLPKKITIRKENARRIFEDKVLPILRSHNANFDIDNTEYQLLTNEYYQIVEQAKEIFSQS